MPLTLIIGPMKSGKSLELIARVAPYEYTDKQVVYAQPAANMRDEQIRSRLGPSLNAKKVKTLAELGNDFEVIAIDEIHMFAPPDVQQIAAWLRQGKEVFACGLDIAYNQKLMPTIKAILELKPEIVIDKLAVCDICKQFTARFTQILKKNRVITTGHPIRMSENSDYTYQARCRTCYVPPSPAKS